MYEGCNKTALTSQSAIAGALLSPDLLHPL